mgnify:CR=1 FL=1
MCIRDRPDAGSPVRWVRVKYNPTVENEITVVTLSDDGYLDAYVWDGFSWSVTNNIGYVGTTVNAYRCFDLVYESSSGDAMLVFSTGGTNPELQYVTRARGSTTWSVTGSIDLEVNDPVYWVAMERKPGNFDEIAVIITVDSSTLTLPSLSERNPPSSWPATPVILE